MRRTFILSLTLTIVYIVCSEQCKGQLPPRPLEITTAGNLGFGAFYQGAGGGTLTVSSSGARSATGDIILMGTGPAVTPAVFNITGAEGALINLTLDANVPLTGAPLGSLILNINSTDPVSPFVIRVPYPGVTSLSVGGTLSIGSPASNPPGTYSGTFSIVFIQNYE